LVWSPLAGGLLSGQGTGRETGRWRKTNEGSRRTDVSTSPPVNRRPGLMPASGRDAADRCGHSALRWPRWRLAWLLHQPQVTSVIVGPPKRPDQLADNLGATKVGAELPADPRCVARKSARLPSEYPGPGCSSGRANIDASRSSMRVHANDRYRSTDDLMWAPGFPGFSEGDAHHALQHRIPRRTATVSACTASAGRRTAGRSSAMRIMGRRA